MMAHDLFICHASEDKDDLARPLSEALRQRGLKVWYDEFEMYPGRSLRQSVDEGLAQSRYAVVIVSEHFFQKNWPQWELNGLVQRHLTSDRPFMIPIWHEVDSRFVSSHSPPLADILAIRSGVGVDGIAEQIVEMVGPQPRSLGRIVSSLPTATSTSGPASTKGVDAALRRAVSSLHRFASARLRLDSDDSRLRLSLSVAARGADGMELEVVASSADPTRSGARFKASGTLSGWVLQTANRVIVPDVRALAAQGPSEYPGLTRAPGNQFGLHTGRTNRR